jgi:hypothetical protein
VGEQPLNPYHYVLSLRLRHPTMNLSEATGRLGLAPSRVWQVGASRKDPKGVLLSGLYPESYWTAPLLNGEKILSTDVPLDESLVGVVRQLTPHGEYLNSIRVSKGRCECFVGLFSSANFGMEIPAALMRVLADLGLDLGIDGYP